MPVSPVIVPSPNVGTHSYVTIVDQQGYVIGTVASSDGALFGSISGESQFLFNSGGPPLLDGSPSQLTFDRVRGYLGKSPANGTISATSTGDVNLVFSTAPKTLMPGQAIRLGNSFNEYVYVDPTFLPSASATTIPLKSPIVRAGNTTAFWDAFDPTGPNHGTMSALGIGLIASALVNAASATQMVIAENAMIDGQTPLVLPEVVPGRLQGGSVERERGPSVFKPFNAQAVTISSANTPTAIWTPTTGMKFRLMGYWFSSTVACSLLFHDLATVGSGGLMGCPSPIMAAAGSVQCPPIGNGILSAAINNKLWIDATAATTLTGFVFGTEE